MLKIFFLNIHGKYGKLEFRDVDIDM